MAQIDILKNVLDYSLRKFEHHIIGSRIYFIFNNERFAYVELKKVEHKNEYDGISICYISKLYGFIDKCDICFKDVFVDSKRAIINVDKTTDTYDWYETYKPSGLDLSKLAEDVETFINFVCDFGNSPFDYLGSMHVIQGASQYQPQRHIVGQPVEFLPYDVPTELSEDLSEDIEQVKENHTIEEQPVELFAEEFDKEDSDVLTVEENEEELKEIPRDCIDVLESEKSDVSDNEPDNSNLIENEVKESEFNIVEESNATISDDEKEIVAEAEQVEIPVNSVDSSKDTTSQKKGFFGFLKGKDKKKTEVPSIDKSSKVETHTDNKSVPSVESDRVDNSDELESSSVKPFITWNIGAKKDSDVIAALYNTEEKGVYFLVISGKGNMKDFKGAPWSQYKDQIKNIEIKDGVTSIGNNSFKSFGQLKSIVLPDSIEKIGLSAFEFCYKLGFIHWSKNLRLIGKFAFSGTEKLKEVVLPDSVEEIQDYAFDTSGDFKVSCNNPSKLHLGAGMSQSDFVKIDEKPIKINAQNYML